MKKPKSKKVVGDDVDPVAKELGDLKRLLVLLVLKTGVTQGEVANALDLSQPSVSRLFGAVDKNSIRVSVVK